MSAKERASRSGEVPYYGAAGQVGWIDKPLFDEPLLLLGEDGVQFFDPAKSKAYVIDGPAWVNNHAHVLRARHDLVERRFLMYYLNWTGYHGFANGTTRLKLTKSAMTSMPIPLPSLIEQRRIVEILEDHLSRLDAASEAIRAAAIRLDRWELTALSEATHGGKGPGVRLDEVAEVRLGRQRSPANHTGDRMRPYLRAGNVHWNRFRLDEVKEMNFTSAEEESYRLVPGDILVVEASGSAAEVGKSAEYQGAPANVCFQNTLLRVRCHSANPAYVQKYLLAEALSGRLIEESRGVGIHHIGKAKLAALRIEIPATAEQSRRVNRAESVLESGLRLRSAIDAAHARSVAVRRSLLAAAFAGRLEGRTGNAELLKELASV